jgi:hypothetical protein
LNATGNQENYNQKGTTSQVPVAHAYNPSYLGGRDQEDSKPVQANSSLKPYSKTFHKNRDGGVAQDEGPEFKPQYCKKKKKRGGSRYHEDFGLKSIQANSS